MLTTGPATKNYLKEATKDDLVGFYSLLSSLLSFSLSMNLAGGFSLESEWQQISSDLQNTSQYFNQYQWYCGQDISIFPRFLSLLVSFSGSLVLFQVLWLWLVSLSPSYFIFFQFPGKVHNIIIISLLVSYHTNSNW